MARRTLTMILLCLTLGGASMAMAPAASAAPQPPNLPCEVFAPPYDYPCGVAESTILFVWDQAGDVVPFVRDVVDEADETADNAYHTVSCTINPGDPDC